jgi:hypothetical protein
MTDIQMLLDTLEIQRLKARYFRYMDHRDWEKYRDLFTDDLKFYISYSKTREANPPVWSSADELVSYLSSCPPTKLTIHHGHMPDIEFIDENHASGIWAMFDWVDYPERGYAFKGYGYYYETYVRCDDGRWRIDSSHLTRLRTNEIASLEHHPLPFTPS